MAKHSSKIYLLIIVISVSFNIWLYISKDEIIKEKDKIASMYKGTVVEKESIKTDLNDMLLQYDDLKTNNYTLNKRLENEKEKIMVLLKKIKNIKSLSSQKISLYKKELATLRKIMRSFVVQIDSLNTANKKLIAKNNEVNMKYETVKSEKEELIGIKDSLSGTVAIAKIIKAQNAIVSGLNRRGRTTRRSSKLATIKFCLTLLDNELAVKGSKYIYLRVSAPNKKILSSSDDKLFEYNGEKIAYSSSRKVEYNGKKTDICVFWKKDEELTSGLYYIDAFVDGNKVATKTLTLK